MYKDDWKKIIYLIHGPIRLEDIFIESIDLLT